MAYEKVNWTSTTPINTTNLNKMDKAIEQHFNEVDADNIELNEKIGDLTTLNTTEKNNLVGAINGVVESGSNENGEWIKYVDGTMICAGAYKVTTARNTTWGSLYVSPEISGIAYPIPFKEIKSVDLTLEASGNTVWSASADKGSTTNTPSYYIVSATGTSYESEYITNYIAIGKWK
jgi:hypothetical protein